MEIEGFADISVTNFLDSLPKFQELHKQLIKYYKIKSEKKIITGDLFKNQIVVFTGFRMDAWKKYIEEQGGEIKDKVSKNTTLLVHSDDNTSSTNYQKAVELNIKIMTKTQFAKKFNL